VTAATLAAPTDWPTLVKTWSHRPANVPRARHELRRELAEWGLPALADTAELVLAELLTNAIRHARSPAGRRIETRYRMTSDGLRIEVHDANLTLPAMPPEVASEAAESGRGLALVAALTGGRCGADERRAGNTTSSRTSGSPASTRTGSPRQPRPYAPKQTASTTRYGPASSPTATTGPPTT